MKNRIRILIPLVFVLLMGSSILYATSDIEEWQYTKEIHYKKELQYKQIFLDEEIYRYAKGDLSDIRIINHRGEFVPYYLYNRYLSNTEETHREYQSKIILDFMKKNDRYLDYQIINSENNRDIEGNQLLFYIKDSIFLKNINIYGSYDNEKWHFIKEDYLYRTSESEKLIVDFEEGYKYEYYRIVFLKESEGIYVEDMTLIYNQKEIKYDHFIKTISADFEVDVKDKEKQTEILINNINHLKISQIKIISEDNYRRNFTTYIGVEGDDKTFRRMGGGEIYQVSLENFVDRRNRINIEEYSLKPINQETIKIVIYDFDNRPIKIKDIEITYYIDKLVFPSIADENYRILFGNRKAEKPIYDIASYQQHIEELEQEKSSVSPAIKLKEEKKFSKVNWLNQRIVLNSVLVLVSILLIIIIFRKTSFRDI